MLGYSTVSGRSWVPWKARSSTLFSWLPSSKLSAERFLQLEKAHLPMCVTLFGMTMLLILVLSKQLYSIRLSREPGSKTTSRSCLHYAKASSPIFLTLLETTTLLTSLPLNQSSPTTSRPSGMRTVLS